MTARTQLRVALAALAFTAAATLAGIATGVASTASVPVVLLVALPLVAIVYVAAGTLLVSRLPANPIGWIVIGIGFFQGLNLLTSGYADFAFARDGNPLAIGGLSGWASGWTWAPSIGLLVTFLILLFPDGHPPSPRWRPVGWLAGAGIVVGVVGIMIGGWSLRHGAFRDPNSGPTGIGAGIAAFGLLMVGIAAALSIASLVVRFRRSVDDERQQLRWFLFAATFVLLATVIGFTPGDTNYVALAIGLFLLPVCIVVAVLKYRLYDIDVVIKKTAVALVLTVLIGVPSLFVLAIASQVLIWGVPNPVFTLVGGVLLGMLVLPLLRVARRVADRIVYGTRATSYEVLTDFSERLADTYATDDVLTRMAEILRNGTGATGATVWLRVGDALHPAATAGEVGPLADVGIRGDALPPMPAKVVSEVRHHGELLGALALSMPPNDPIDARRERLLRDLSSQAGAVLRNVRLIEELRASRQRLVAAQDEERRKLERNIHDGAQQQLVALSVKQRLAESLVGRDDERLRAMLRDLQAETNSALDDLRDLARGIYPPLLADKGLTAALEAQARKAAVPVTVDAHGIGRFPQDVEATVYFCTLEALNNVAKYADATRATIRLANGDGLLRVEVSDDGCGFDPSSTTYGTGLQGMQDRLAAVGGLLSVESEPGYGTTVKASVPASEER